MRDDESYDSLAVSYRLELQETIDP